ncbi:hypothetical protein HZC34_06185 [Candidatus Saganbacteria bacterium]|nr:hypothetical protein [Candidatus Saganbacteria bacterium]
MKRVLYILLVILLAISSSAFAATPHIITVQGRLLRSGGIPVNGIKTATFMIIEEPNLLLWLSDPMQVTLIAGVFSVDLDLDKVDDESLSSPNLLTFDKPCKIITNIDGTVFEQKIAAVPYALNAEKLNGMNITKFATLDASGNIIGAKAEKYVKKTGDVMSGGLIISSGGADFGLVASGEIGGVKGTYLDNSDAIGMLGYGKKLGFAIVEGKKISKGTEFYGAYGKFTDLAQGGLGVQFPGKKSFGAWGVGGVAGGYFESQSGYGLIAIASNGSEGGALGGYNVFDTSDTKFGVAGISDSGNGVYGDGDAAYGGEINGIFKKAGVFGKGGAKTSGVLGYSEVDNPNRAGVVGINPNGYAGIFSGIKGMNVSGSLEVKGDIRGIDWISFAPFDKNWPAPFPTDLADTVIGYSSGGMFEEAVQVVSPTESMDPYIVFASSYLNTPKRGKILIKATGTVQTSDDGNSPFWVSVKLLQTTYQGTTKKELPGDLITVAGTKASKIFKYPFTVQGMFDVSSGFPTLFNPNNYAALISNQFTLSCAMKTYGGKPLNITGNIQAIYMPNIN